MHTREAIVPFVSPHSNAGAANAVPFFALPLSHRTDVLRRVFVLPALGQNASQPSAVLTLFHLSLDFPIFLPHPITPGQYEQTPGSSRCQEHVTLEN